MGLLKRTIERKIDDICIYLLKTLISEKYSKADACIVYCDKDYIHYSTSTCGGIFDNTADACIKIRKKCGENILTINGLPKPETKPMQLVLIPTISLFKNLGFDNVMKFFQDWRGDSKVGEITVVNYSVFI